MTIDERKMCNTHEIWSLAVDKSAEGGEVTVTDVVDIIDGSEEVMSDSKKVKRHLHRFQLGMNEDSSCAGTLPG